MNRTYRTFALLAVLLAGGIGQAEAYDFSAVCSTGQTLYYDYGGGVNGVTVTYPGSSANSPWSGYTKPTGTLIIPSTVTHDGVTYNVVTIGNYAFYNCSSITSLTLPNSVTQIGMAAFHDCTGMVWLTTPDSLMLMGDQAFLRCRSLLSVALPNTLIAVPAEAFEYCSALTTLTVGSGVASFGNSAFDGCSSLTAITSYRSTAPALGSYALLGVPATATVTVPCGSLASYQSTWSTLSNFTEMPGPTFSAASADSTIGIVNILTHPTCAAPTAVIEAVAGAGYHSAGGQIVVEGAGQHIVTLFDLSGRLLDTRQGQDDLMHFDVPSMGAYLVKLGNCPARKVVVW